MKKVIQYRELLNFEEYPDLGDIQHDAWKMPDVELVPKRLIYATLKSGGVVIGAYLEEELIGYTWGWIGNKEPYGVFIYSHHNAVREKYQNQGIGLQLKLEQRNWAMNKGYKLINWTFDPLQSKNCYLNLHKLGATCETYNVNYWGEMKDALNVGLETDRLYCNWYLNSDHVKEYLAHKHRDFTEIVSNENHSVLKTRRKGIFLEITEMNLTNSNSLLAIEIPSNIIDYLAKNKTLAIEWRNKTRDSFKNYFSKGYKIIDFVIMKENKSMRCFHMLKK